MGGGGGTYIGGGDLHGGNLYGGGGLIYGLHFVLTGCCRCLERSLG